MLVRIVVLASGGVLRMTMRVRVLVTVRAGILMMAERHALTGDDRCHPLQRQERHQRKREKPESSEHHRLFYVSKIGRSRGRPVPRMGQRGP